MEFITPINFLPKHDPVIRSEKSDLFHKSLVVRAIHEKERINSKMVAQENSLFNQQEIIEDDIDAMFKDMADGGVPPQYTLSDQQERENQKNHLVVVEDTKSVLKLEEHVINPLQNWTKQQAQEYFNTIKTIQEVIDQNIDREHDQMTIQGNTFDLKSALEKITTLTGIIPKYMILSEDYSHDNACVKYTVKCVVCTKNGVPMGVGVGSCSSFDNKEAYTWVKPEEIPKWRLQNRTVEGEKDPFEPKRIYDPANNIWIEIDDLEKNDKGKVKIPYTMAEYRENQHKIYRKAHVRALREAISYALNRGSHNKKGNRTFSTVIDKSKLTLNCSKCGTSITEKVAEYSVKKHKKELCMDCQKG